jgi:hypothetical protein
VEKGQLVLKMALAKKPEVYDYGERERLAGEIKDKDLIDISTWT